MGQEYEGNDPVGFLGCECKHATERACLIIKPNGQEQWVPQSVIHDDSEVYKKGDEGKLVLMKWWVDKNGFDVK